MDKKQKNATIKEITPNKFLCGLGGCPSVFDGGNETYFIIGKKVNNPHPVISKKCARDECVVEVPKEMIDLIHKK